MFMRFLRAQLGSRFRVSWQACRIFVSRVLNSFGLASLKPLNPNLTLNPKPLNP